MLLGFRAGTAPLPENDEKQSPAVRKLQRARQPPPRQNVTAAGAIRGGEQIASPICFPREAAMSLGCSKTTVLLIGAIQQLIGSK